MARRRKWRTAVQQQPTASSPIIATQKSDTTTAAPTALPTADLRRVSLILVCLFAVLASIVAYAHSGSNAMHISDYLGRMLHIQS